SAKSHRAQAGLRCRASTEKRFRHSRIAKSIASKSPLTFRFSHNFQGFDTFANGLSILSSAKSESDWIHLVTPRHHWETANARVAMMMVTVRVYTFRKP